MKQVFKAVALLSCICICLATAKAQNVVQAEYFFGTDPGFGNATQISISTPAANIPSLSFGANVSSLSNGVHMLYLRTKDANGRWSQTHTHLMAKVQPVFTNPNTAVNVDYAEYFVDTDPGAGNGTAISLTPAVNISNLSFGINIASISPGIHTLYLRVKDAQGKWSIVSNMLFAKVQTLSGNPHTTSNITKLEYFFDSDPGLGNGTDVPVTANADISGMAFNANVSSLTPGIHTLYLRSKDAQGKWSIVQHMQFAKVQPPQTNPHTAGNIVKMEYFFNADPGLGNGIDVPVAPGQNLSNVAFNASVASLSTGLHTLYVRTKDAQGKWSITFHQIFTRIQGLSGNPAIISKIEKAEYFFNTDPGLGNGFNIPLTPGTDISAISFNANISSLGNGIHTLYVRSRDSLGQWSITQNLLFAKVQAPATNPHSTSNIVKLEYFYDNDPGFGNGTDVPVTAAPDISTFAFTANVASLTNGIHTLYLRAKDAQGKWSIVNNTSFAKVQPLSTNPHSRSNISRIEYFVDTDPGIGNATPLTFTPDTGVSNLTFNVDMTVLVNGPHRLYIRSRDAQGKWSITNIHPFNGGTAPLSIQLISFEAKLQPNKQVQLEWITEQEKDVARYIIDRSRDASNWENVGEQLPLSSNATERRVYQMLDKEPGTGVIYYRLTEVDLNGKKTQAPIRFVKIGEEEHMASSLFPNPNDGKRINISSGIFADGEVTIAIMASDGKIHLSETVNAPHAGTFTLSDVHLAAGSYFVNLTSKHKAESLKLQVIGNQF